ncbi:MAG TPA: hypothetical protein VEF72_29640 [Mycobacterium sp.]|nr:hypothetical protein [Mycobacterium sp.]
MRHTATARARVDVKPRPAGLAAAVQELVPANTSPAHTAALICWYALLHLGSQRNMGALGRRGLEMVPDPDTDEPDVGVDDWRAETVLRQWDPERQLIGALMWLTAAQARPVLELVPDTAIWRPMTRWAYEIIRSLVAAGRDPNAVIVLRTAASQPPADDIRSKSASDTSSDAPGVITRPYRHAQLARYLFDAYSQAPAAAAACYAREVLDAAYRRAFRQQGIHMQQLADCADRADLTEQFSTTTNSPTPVAPRRDRRQTRLG